MILNIISCFLGIGIYLSIIFIIYSKGGYFVDNFKIVFDVIDKIFDGDFLVFIDSSKYKYNCYNYIMNVLV